MNERSLKEEDVKDLYVTSSNYSSMYSIDYMGKMKMIVTYFEIPVILFASTSLCY